MKCLNKKIVIFIFALISIATAIVFIPVEIKTIYIKIGVSDDSSGLIIDYLIRNKGLKDISTKKEFQSYSIKDCCSNTASWALSSQLLDVAIMCPDSAENLVKKDNRFEVLGPCILNSDIFIVKSQDAPKSFGMSQNRNGQERMVKDKYGDKTILIPMLTISLPYALEKESIDGIVIDSVKGFFVKGNKISSFNNKDNVSYVLVVSKKFKKDKRYEKFLKAFKESIDELNNINIFVEEFSKYKNVKVSKEEVNLWNQLKMKFVFTVPEEK